MNVTFNPNVLGRNNQQKYQQNNKQNYKQNFTGKTPAAEIAELMSAIPEKSKLLKNIDAKYEKAAESIAKHFTKKLVDNPVTAWCVEKVKNSKYLFNHMMAVGSAITSGMYIVKTLKNEELDKDRKNTLAINQFLTFGISTVGAYVLDSKLGNWWDKMTAKYAAHQLNDKTLMDEFLKKNAEIVGNNVKIIAENKTKMPKKELKLLLNGTVSVKDFIKERVSYKAEVANSQKRLLERIDGMGVLKTMIIFAMVYRFLVPVLVTPVANRLGDKMIERRKAKEAEALKATGVQQSNKEDKKEIEQTQIDKKA